MRNLKGKHSEHETADDNTEVCEASEAYSQQLASAHEFVKRWTECGPALEEQRCRQLQQLDDETARRMMLDLFALWRPKDFDDPGSGLVEQQRIFARLREHVSGRKCKP